MSPKISIARVVALETLEKVFSKRPTRVDDALSESITKHQPDSRDAALAYELCFGVVRNQTLLDYYIEPLLTRIIRRTQPTILHILRMGVYQKAFLERIPDFALVNESVNLARERKGSKAANFVNAVLRKFVDLPRLPELPQRSANNIRYLSIKYSVPEWLTRYLLIILGEKDAEWFMATSNKPAPIDLRVNKLKTTLNKTAERLRECGFNQLESMRFSPAGIRIQDGNIPQLIKSGLLAEGLVTVQDQAAQLVSYLVAPEPGDTIIDLCAAPGGKTTHCAELCEDKGSIFAMDINRDRLRLVEEQRLRLGLEGIRVLHPGSNEIKQFSKSKVDRVLVDAPCTALGTLRRNPDVRWARDPKDCMRMAKLQLSLCEKALSLLKPGGILVYSVCTVTDEETKDIVNTLETRFPGLIRESARDFLPAYAHEITTPDGLLRVFPHQHEMDGFFAVRFRNGLPQ
jgi:16S rRNA (cytosine967-C5)-methyltransferase